MRLLVLTQAVDKGDPYLSFFVGWLDGFAERFERINVVCLKQGAYRPPKNVRVHSLGKEGGESRLKYVLRFYRSLWTLRREYDAVLVHMNQEYVLLGGLPWILMGKRVYLWRNHYAGGPLTRLAALFCRRVFCTSRSSYTARFAKTTLMPVGVDTSAFTQLPDVVRAPRSVLFYARMAPSKRPDVLLEALSALAKKGIEFSASFYGSALPQDAAYEKSVHAKAKELGLSGRVAFHEGTPHNEGPRIFSGHEVFVNLARSGMYDKTIFEAAACGCIVLAASRDFAALVDARYAFGEDGSDLAAKLADVLEMPQRERDAERMKFRNVAETQSLSSLAEKLEKEMSV